MEAAISIAELSYSSPIDHFQFQEFQVSLAGTEISTLVTTDPSQVDSWIDEIYRVHSRRLHCLIVGLDVEWRPSFNRYVQNKVATIQLCVGRRCLIFQLIYAQFVPESLVSFLSDRDFTFVGVGIEADAEKLQEDYGLWVAARLVDLRSLAADSLGEEDLKRAGLKTLAKRVLDMDVSKPRRVTMSRWDDEWLTHAQVQYACVDAYLSFEIGRVLGASSGNYF